MQLLVGIEVQVFAAGALLREPGVEAGGDEAVGALLLIGGADRERVGVLVLDVLVVAPDPAPVDRMRCRNLRQLLPQLGVLERARFAAPAARLPALDPLRHALDEILRVRNEADVGVPPLAADPFQRRDRSGERHLVVCRLGRTLVEIPARHAVPRRRLDQRGVAPTARLGGVVAETTLVGMHEYEQVGHGSITTGMSVCSRMSSACETVTAFRWPTCAPANSASHCVRWITRATASPGVPDSRWVTNATPWSESTASASPTTRLPLAGSIVA